MKKGEGWYPVCWWQRHSVSRQTETELRVWTFSPIGFHTITGWNLMSYSLSTPCGLGNWHIKERRDLEWEQIINRCSPKVRARIKKKPPKPIKLEIPEDVWKQLMKETKKIKTTNPWPGS